MDKILLISSIQEETKDIKKYFDNKIKTQVCGIGSLNTIYNLTRLFFQESFDLIIQTGIAGAFVPSGSEIGDIVIASKEIDIDFGLEHKINPFYTSSLPQSLAHLKQSYLLDKKLNKFAIEHLRKHFNKVKAGAFVSSQKITRTRKRADNIYNKFKPIAENMEGFAAAYFANMHNIPIIEIRAISNFVGKRILKKWDLNLAFKNSAEASKHLIEAFL